MKLSQGQKILLAVLTILPFLVVPFLIFIFVGMMMSAANDSFELIYPAIFSFIFPIILISLLSLGLFIFYIIHVVSNQNLDSGERILWILLFVFVGFIVFPIYLFLRIWNDHKIVPAQQ